MQSGCLADSVWLPFLHAEINRGNREMIEIKNVSFSYKSKYQVVEALKNVSCTFQEGKIYAIYGESGSGKSTLLSLMAGLDVADDGCLLIDGKDILEMDRDAYRKNRVAVIYQSFYLFPLLNALENIMYPLEMRKIGRKEAKEQALGYLKEVGLSEEVAGQFPKMMSGGQQQRVAIARAMANGGKILLADEPTGNLDSENEAHVVQLLKSLAHEKGQLVVVVTHNQDIVRQCDVKIKMKDGRIESISE